MDEKGGITFFRRKFFVSQCQKSSWASLKCFRKFRVSKNFMHTRGYHVFPSKIFCLSAENFCRGILYCCNNFGYRKSLDKGGGITIFRRFCLTVLKYFIGEHFGASEKFFHRKFSCIGGGITVLSKTFCLTVPINLLGEPFCAVFQKFSGSE